MGILDFIKTLGLSAKINTIYKPFFNAENLKLTSTEIMNDIPQNIQEIYYLISSKNKYNDLIKIYNDYYKNYINHNNLIKKIEQIAKNFNLDLIISNPDIVDYNSIISENIDAYNALCKLKTTDKLFKIYKEDFKEFKENFNIIKEQYHLYLDSKNLTIDYSDKYLDGRVIKALEEGINLYKKKFNNYVKQYYKPKYPNPSNIVKLHNDTFIQKHLYDPIFNDINGRSLDVEQRQAILCDAVSNLIIAGAGSGKTLTICGKVKYLLEVMGIPEDEILLLSYSNNSAEDLRKKVNNISPDMKVYTFHALGLEILNQINGKKLTVDNSFNAVIGTYFRDNLKNDANMLKKVFDYYGLYLSNYEFEKKYSTIGDKYAYLKQSDFTTLKDQLKRLNSSNTHIETLKSEYVNSFEELAIANFLFLNGIDYEYESSYKGADTSSKDRRQYTPDFYLPKYDLYYEHYGIDKNGRATQYDENEELNYINAINWKRNLHQQYGTTCIETYSYEFLDGTIFDNLEKRLKENKVEFHPLSSSELTEKLNFIIEGQSFKSFMNFIRTFIALYKSRYEDNSSFDKLININFVNSYDRKRANLFTDICKGIYDFFITHLQSEKKIDFDDMILKSTKALESLFGYKYKYIIVDEFQDISYSRMTFLKSLIRHGNSKLFAVGDDWQAIYRFSGCDINIFLYFENYFEMSEKNFITSTHRNSQELQDIACPFIIANPEQFDKKIISDLHLDKPVRIMFFEDNKYQAFMNILKDISNKDANANVLLLGRNNKDIDTLESNRFYREGNTSKYISVDYPRLNINFITAHGSKGLEEDYVVIINADDSKYGFPNKFEDDILLDLVLSSRSKYQYAEERRLWYVALTRTRLYTYILANNNSPSIFVKEIEKKCFIMNSDDRAKVVNPILCPNCKSGRLVLRARITDNHQFFGCSNFPYCGYTNGDLKQVNTNHRCSVCGDFMSIRQGPYGLFWGCRNYPNCIYTDKKTV